MPNGSSGAILIPPTSRMCRRAASIAAANLAATGDNGRTQPCAGCHGADLRSGPQLEGPPLAGRFASYLFRQLYGFQSGARAGDCRGADAVRGCEIDASGHDRSGGVCRLAQSLKVRSRRL